MSEQKVFCMKCKKDLTNIEKLNQCECGSKDFIYGDTVTMSEGKFLCNCGCTEMEKIAHINMNPTYITTYECCECGAKISTETYFESIC